MSLINYNPFRILGLPITASEREIAKQINTLATYAEMGKTKSFDADLPFLPAVERTPEVIEESKKKIEQSESKLLHSLFWFWKNNSADELALELLKEGNTAKAIEIWEKSVFTNRNKIYKPVVLFKNLIRQKTTWSELDNEDHFLHKNEDEYLIERKKETSSSIPTVSADLNYNDNWTIEVDTEWKDGTDNIGYGIIFGREGGSYYMFDISANGYFCFSKNIDWVFNKIIPWKESVAIENWASNHIMIKKIESQLDFYINGIKVDSVPSEPFFGKYFGFKVMNNQKVSFRNFKFCKLIEDEIYGEGINVTAKNFSSLKNLSTLYLILAANDGTFQIDYFRKGIALAKNFFTTENIEDYSRLIAGEKYSYNSETILHFYISGIIELLGNYIEKSGGISINQLLNAFSTFPVEARQFLNSRFVSKQIQNIEKEIEIAESERKRSRSTTIQTGQKLVINTKKDIEFLKNVLGESDFQYSITGDKLSSAIIQCGIDAFNSCKLQDGEIDYPKAIQSEELYLNEYEFANKIAVSEIAKKKAKDNLDSCKQYIKNKVYHTCWFCGEGTPEKESVFEVTIYEVTLRLLGSVNYSYVPISIPRCKECKNFHRFIFDFDEFPEPDSFGNAGIFSLMLYFAAVILSFLYFILGHSISWLLITIIKIIKPNKAKIKRTNNATIKDFPLLRKKLNDGWQFDKPKA